MPNKKIKEGTQSRDFFWAKDRLLGCNEETKEMKSAQITSSNP
jgi:hypothetical protein